MTTWLCDDLITNVRRKAWLSENNTNFTDEQILRVAYEQASKILLPLVRAVDHTYYLSSYEIALTTAASRYRIPPRAATQVIVSALLFDSNGDESPITRIEPQDFDRLKTTASANAPLYYCVVGSYLKTWPISASNGFTLKINYQRRIPKFVKTTSASTIDSISTTDLTASSTISWITTDPFKIDIMYQDPTADLIVVSEAATAASTTQIDFISAIDSEIVTEITDEIAYNPVYVCLEDTTPIVPFVDTLCFVLEDYAASSILKEQKKTEQAAAMLSDASDYLEKMLDPLRSRVNKAPIKVTNINSPLLGYRW